MLPDRVSNPGPPTYESGALPIALRGPAFPLRKEPLLKELQRKKQEFMLINTTLFILGKGDKWCLLEQGHVLGLIQY